MGRYCSTEEGACHALCDFCRYFESDDNDLEYDGRCMARNEPTCRSWHCEEDFVCFRIED